MSIKNFFKKWWLQVKYEPNDPKYGRGEIKIVAIGGGTGLSNLLRGLKKYSRDITAVVAVSDSGRSSGVIRKVFQTLPPGDIRKCLAALSNDEKFLTEIFDYRFPTGSGFLSGHPLGNIWLAALTQKYGSFEKAIIASKHFLNAGGFVYPSTLDSVKIAAVFENGRRVVGEEKIPKVAGKIKKVFLTNTGAKAYRKSVEAIATADLIIIGPGSLYTSVIPNLLVENIQRAIANNQNAVRIFVANCSSEKGETENMSVADHIEAIKKHSPRRIFDYIIANSRIVKKSSQVNIFGEINNITCHESEICGTKVVSRDIINRKNPLFHDPEKLAKEIIILYNSVKDAEKRNVKFQISPQGQQKLDNVK
ncbi:MAG: YvcK family protein [Candidatus Berkelbacteria bacterium]|nr:YvcK family protein [Candidatus Berkelbacteria bacterium]